MQCVLPVCRSLAHFPVLVGCGVRCAGALGCCGAAQTQTARADSCVAAWDHELEQRVRLLQPERLPHDGACVRPVQRRPPPAQFELDVGDKGRMFLGLPGLSHWPRSWKGVPLIGL